MGSHSLFSSLIYMNNLGTCVHYHNTFKKIVELHVIKLWFEKTITHEVKRVIWRILCVSRPVQASEWSGPVVTVENGCDAVATVRTGILGGHLTWAAVSQIFSMHMCTHLVLIASHNINIYESIRRCLFRLFLCLVCTCVSDLLYPLGKVTERVFVYLLIWVSFLLADFL